MPLTCSQLQLMVLNVFQIARKLIVSFSFIYDHHYHIKWYSCIGAHLHQRIAQCNRKTTGPNNGLLCFTYAITTIVATTMSMAIMVAVGLTGAGNVLATMPDGYYCDKFFHRSAPLLLSLFGITATLQVIAFITAIILICW